MDRKPDFTGAGRARSGGFGQITHRFGVMVTIHKRFGHVYETNIPQNHQFVNRLFVILGKKGVIIYNFFLF
jgi:hypothetical protein